MSKNRVITIAREFGSGGHAIAKRLAEIMGINMYDKDLIKMVAKNSGYSEDVLRDIDETATNSLLYSLSLGTQHYIPMMNGIHSMPINDQAFIICSQIIRDLAAKESCIIVGRCADNILKDHENLFNIFIHTGLERRIDRICEYEKCSRKEAAAIIKKEDRKREAYHNYYADTKWGDCKCYDLCLDSKIGIDEAASIIKYAVELKQ